MKQTNKIDQEAESIGMSEWSGFSSLELCTTVVVRSAVTGPDSSRVLTCQHI